jgi:hypothetical protein
MLEEGKITITYLAKEVRLSPTYVLRIVNLTFLAPEIVTNIMIGTQPTTLQLQKLLENLLVKWDSQKRILGIHWLIGNIHSLLLPCFDA